jgi:nucleotide-binding universal stress UspA family protein
MNPLRCIVAATDLSAPARRAADRAAMIARGVSASLTLVHAVSGSALDELRRWVDTGDRVEQSLLDDVRERLRDLASQLSAEYGIDVDDLVVIGPKVDEIARVARERQADLVVTGTLGSGFLRNRLVGSTAERIVRTSLQPVLMVRHAPREPYRRVLVPVDFSAWSGPSVDIAVAVAPHARFVLMHAVEAPFESSLGLAGIEARVIDEYRAAARSDAMRRMRELAVRAGFQDDGWTTLTADAGDAWIPIIRQEQEQDVDLIAIGKQGRSAMADMLLGSTTNRVIGESSSDVLVCTRSDG